MPRRRNQPPSPLHFYGVTAVFIIVAGIFLLHERYDLGWVEAWLITLNVLGFFFYTLDKFLAMSERKRIPEVVLLGLALAGGSPGGLVSMVICRHKVRKTAFMRPFWIIAMVQILAVLIWIAVTW